MMAGGCLGSRVKSVDFSIPKAPSSIKMGRLEI